MSSSLRRFGISFLTGFLVWLAVIYAASAQGNCPPGCTCHYVDNQFIVDCGGKATTVPPTGEPTDSPGATDEPGETREPRETPRNETPVPQPTNSNGLQFYDLHCVPLGAGDFGLACPKNMYDIRSACGTNLGCWIVYVKCADGCLTPTPRPSTRIGPLPCADVSVGQGGIQCTVAWDTRVSARIPPVPVGYLPFPRGIVYDAMQFNLPPLIVQGWQCNSPSIDGWDPLAWAPSSNYRKLVFCLRWRQVKHPEPEIDPAPAWAEWRWDERPWGNPKGELSFKRETNHTYVTSSAEKPTNGLGERPSYQVQVRTYWVVEWKENWERREEYCVDGNAGDVCNGQIGMRKETRWIPEGRGSVTDLRAYGNANFWASSTRIKTPWGADMNVLPVPVIEVQGVIEK